MDEAEITFWIDGGVHPVSISLSALQVQVVMKALGMTPMGEKFGFFTEETLRETILPMLPEIRNE